MNASLAVLILALGAGSAQTTIGGNQLRETPATPDIPAGLRLLAITSAMETPRLEIGSGLSLMASNGTYILACMAIDPGVTDAAFTRFGQSITVLAQGRSIALWLNGLRQKQGTQFLVSTSTAGVAMVTPGPGIAWAATAVFVIDLR